MRPSRNPTTSTGRRAGDRTPRSRVRAAGAKLWFQNVGQTRYVDGFFMLRAGAVGHRQWVANWPSADPYNDW
ncbi:MAG TPA: hypothetical protein PKL84_16275, partial [Candidatus Hydrogenedentes bacterium]|nr:hypothetical protein [Candidatus Hydrogenedentota bacterium]